MVNCSAIHINMGWYSWSFRSLNALFYTLQVSFEKSTAILMGSPLYVTCVFSSFSFQYTLFFVFVLCILVFIIVCLWDFVFWSYLLGALCIFFNICASFLLTFTPWSWWISCLSHWFSPYNSKFGLMLSFHSCTFLFCVFKTFFNTPWLLCLDPLLYGS